MTFNKLSLSAAMAGALSFSTQFAAAEELSVATFVPPSHETNVGMFKWFGEEIEKRSGGTLTMKLYPAGQLGAGPVQQYKRAIEGVADITFGVAKLNPTIFPKTLLATLPGSATTLSKCHTCIGDPLRACFGHAGRSSPFRFADA